MAALTVWLLPFWVMRTLNSSSPGLMTMLSCNGVFTDAQAGPLVSNSRHYGKLQASFKVAGDRVSGFVTGEETDASQKIAELVQEIEKDLEMNGFAMERMDVAKGTRHSFHVGDKKETTNRKLYQVAKIVVRNVQRKEAEI